MAVNISTGYNSSINVSGPQGGVAIRGGSTQPGSQTQITLKSGDTINGEIVSRQGDDIQLRLSKDVTISAKMEQDIQAGAGDQVTFEVRAGSQGNISLRPLFQNMSSDSPLYKALNQAQLPANDITTRMVTSMMREGMGIDSESLQTMYRAVMDQPDTDIATLVQMKALGLATSPENIQQFTAYKNFEHQLSQAFSQVADEIPGAVAEAFSSGGSVEGNALISSILDTFSPVEDLPTPGQASSQPIKDLSLGENNQTSGQAPQPVSSQGQAQATVVISEDGQLTAPANEGRLSPEKPTLSPAMDPNGIGMADTESGNNINVTNANENPVNGPAQPGSDRVIINEEAIGSQTIEGETAAQAGPSQAPVQEPTGQAVSSPAQAQAGPQQTPNTALQDQAGSGQTINTTVQAQAGPEQTPNTAVQVQTGHEQTQNTPDQAQVGPGQTPNTPVQDKSGQAANSPVQDLPSDNGPEGASRGAQPFVDNDQAPAGTGREGQTMTSQSPANAGSPAAGQEIAGSSIKGQSVSYRPEADVSLRDLGLGQKDMDQLARLMKAAGSSQGLSQAIARGEASGKEVYEALRDLSHRAVSESTRQAVGQAFSSKGFQAVLKDRISSQWTLRDASQVEKREIKDLYERIERQTRDIAKALSEAVKSDSPLAKGVENIRQNVDFINQLNNMCAYVQLPMKWKGMDAHGDLYVYTNKKNLAGKDGAVSAFLHLEMEHLGQLDCYVSMDKDRIATNFTVENDQVLDLLDQHMDLLTSRLEEKGYTTSARLALKGQDTDPGEEQGIMNEILKGNRNISAVSMQAFDMRA